MAIIISAFLTGLLTGGLSCLAVQGGLLAGSLAQQVEKDVLARQRSHLAGTILWFLGAKLAVYTLLGFLLGLLGSVLQLNAVARAILQMAIGLFMIGTALRLLKVHPIFRYFVFEPPAFVTRSIRRVARGRDAVVTPALLGALTVLIPCGITQAVMVTAVGSGSGWLGAAILFAFVLGTSPLFFMVAYLATQLGAVLEKSFMRVVAVLVLILGLVTINTGLNLLGSPYSLTNLVRLATPPLRADEAGPTPAVGGVPGVVLEAGTAARPAGQVLTLNVLNSGYAPEVLQAPANTALQLQLITQGTYSCSRAFVIPALGVEKLLPATGVETVDIPSQPAGTVLRFSCSMGMYTGQIKFN